jgi:hypothetical protein
MSFSKWLIKQRRRNDRVGDLARDFGSSSGMEGGPSKPRGRVKRQTYHNYLDGWNACTGAHEALEQAWSEWEAGVSSAGG